jgi:predicted RNA-binding Zn-ribbon protein involved in translation (DUF1610 family)
VEVPAKAKNAKIDKGRLTSMIYDTLKDKQCLVMRQSRKLNKDNSGYLEDWKGNNIAFNCPVCGKVYIVSGLLDQNGRECPNCGKSRGFVDKHGEIASVEWDTASSLILKLN